MKRTAGALVLLAALGGCVTTDHYQTSSGCGSCGVVGSPPTIPGVQGPWGQPVAMAAPYSATPPSGADAARAMMALSVPLDLVQQANATHRPGDSSGIQLAGGPGALPQAGTLMDGGIPGAAPTPGGLVPPIPGAVPPPGSIAPPGLPYQPFAPGLPPPPGAVAAVGALTGPTVSRFPTRRTEVRFVGPAGMKVSWYGPGGFGASRLDVPGRYNFPQAAIYRLKLSDIPNRPGLELYPTLEVVPSNARTDPFLAHSAVPVAFTEEDLDQVLAGNYLVKVIYLPNPELQEVVTLVGPDEIVSTRLEPGLDPIAEAYRRGSILLVIRLGNIDLEAPNSPAMDAPSPYRPPAGTPGCAPSALMHVPSAGTPLMGPSGPPLMGGQVLPPPALPARMGPSQPMNLNGPVSQLPGSAPVQQAQYTASAGPSTPAQLASQPANPATSPVSPPDTRSSSSPHWWWPGSGTDK